MDAGNLWDLPLERWPETAWTLLGDSLAQPGHPLRCPAVATVGDDGPGLRVVVLRQVLPAERRLRFYTDARSPKTAELASRPLLSWVFYDPARRLQIRARGLAQLHRDGPVAEHAWSACDQVSRRNYRGRQVPGAVITGPDGELLDGVDDCGAGREHFTVVCGQVERMDVLLLGAEGNRRLGMTWRQGAWRCDWLAP